MIRRTTHRPALSLAGALVTLGLIAGCSAPVPAPSASPSAASPSASASSAPSASASASAPAVDPAAVAAARESVAAGISSGNTAAIASWMADSVLVTIAASGFQEDLVPDEAAAQLSYVIDLTATWNFALSEATIDTYRAGFYEPYFTDDVLVGLSSTGAVIAFDFEGAEVVGAFMAIDESLLL